MIVQSLAPITLQRLHKNGFVRLQHDGDEYVITYRKSKYFQVTRRLPGKRSRSARTTVRIYDIFTFFMCSFVKAYEDMIGPLPGELIQQGKDKRKDFTIGEFDFIEKYWTLEIECLRELAEELRSRVYGAGLRITEWHGPGALASYSMKQQGIKQHMSRINEDVRLAARYAYAAGRFELFKVGRVVGPVYGIDRNSAYPFGLTRLPSLTEGSWEYQNRCGVTQGSIQSFGLYHLKMARGSLLQKTPSPLFHRDRHHELSFPWHTEGWYWGPEAIAAVKRGATVIEAWEYKGWSTRPFAYIEDTYAQRKRWKAEGNSAEMALKLCMNAITGKAAQRVGWDEKTGRIPGWHQLEWAGSVTSFTRAGMFELMSKIPYDKLISIETDGIYTTMSPAELGITASKELGGWSVDVYSEAMYVQSGLAWLRKQDGTWETKRRGLDKDTFTLAQCQDYLRTLGANEEWPEYEGLTTRFTSMGQALASRDPKSKHCVWVTDKRSISVGRQGKRIHVAQRCDACAQGVDAYTRAHDLVISPQSIQDGKPASYPHSIPWEPEVGHAWWRDQQEEEDNYV